MTKTLAVTIGGSVQKELKRVAKKEGKSYSEKVRNLIKRYLAEKDTISMDKMEYNLWQFKRDFNTFRTRKVTVNYAFPNNKLPYNFKKIAREKKMSISSLLELVLAHYLYPHVRKDRAWTRE